MCYHWCIKENGGQIINLCLYATEHGKERRIAIASGLNRDAFCCEHKKDQKRTLDLGGHYNK